MDGEREGQLVPSLLPFPPTRHGPLPNPGRFDWHNEVTASWHKAAPGSGGRGQMETLLFDVRGGVGVVRVCLGDCHPGPTGLLITLSVTWHLLGRGDGASPANMGLAARSLFVSLLCRPQLQSRAALIGFHLHV